jgi:GAF domain-containing protein
MSISQNPSQSNLPTLAQRIVSLWQRLTAPHPSLTTIVDKRRAQLLSIMTLILSILFAAALIYGPRSYDIFIAQIIITLISYGFSRTPNYRAGNYLFTYAFTALAFFRIYQGGADSIEAAIVSTVHISLVFSSVLLSQRGFLGLVLLSTIATFTAPLYSNILPTTGDNIGRTGGVVLTIGAILYGINLFRENLDKENRKELSDTNSELSDVKVNLEKRIEERTLEIQNLNRQAQARSVRLQNITDISQEISSSTSLGMKEMLTNIAKNISDKFGYYHVGIFLLDEKRDYAILRAANSQGGQQMLARRHQIKVGGTGIVGYAAQSGRSRIALNTGADAVFFNNPDLPETRSEISLPLKFENSVIGILDVQSTEPSAFSEEDASTLGAIANLLTIAIRNLQLLEQDSAGSMASAAKIASFNRKEKQGGYSYRPEGITAANIQIDNEPAIKKALTTGEVTVLHQTSLTIPSTIVVPVKLRDQVIGLLHIESAEANRKWTEDEITLVQSISDRAAFALENARLLEDATRRAEQEETIARVTTKIGASTDFDRILQTTIQEIGQALGVSRSFIQIGTANSEENRD